MRILKKGYLSSLQNLVATKRSDDETQQFGNIIYAERRHTVERDEFQVEVDGVMRKHEAAERR